MKPVMRPVPVLPAAIAGLLLALTWLMLQGATPDAVLHERILDALRNTTIGQAALHRDVLRARAGLLRNYDPLVAHLDSLGGAVATLETAARTAHGSDAPLRERVDAVAVAVRDQEALVDTFKSSNALLQNSMKYFSHITRDTGLLAAGPPGAAVEMGALGNAMLRFAGEPEPGNADEVRSSLARLSGMGLAGPLQETARTLVAHGGIILATLPQVDDVVRRLLGSPLEAHTRALQDTYLRRHGAAVARAGTFRVLLYAASMFLAGYLGYLFLRLRANARALRARIAFERLIAGISTQFINLSRDRLDDGINDALARLAEHAEVDRARIDLCPGSEAKSDAKSEAKSVYTWHRPGVPHGVESDLSAMALSCGAPGSERLGCTSIPRVSALADGPDRARLSACGVRSWLCVPMRRGGVQLGCLTLAAVRREREWPDDDITLLRTAAEIFASAIDRDRAQAEREALEARLHQAQRLEAIGTLAGGIAHEFNNILGGILGYAEMAMAALASGGRARRHVEQVMKAGRRAQGIVDQILAFSRRSDRRHRPVLVQSAVEEAVGLLRASLPSTVAIRTRLEAGAAAVLGDRTQLEQVVVNLCTNAAHASDARGAIDLAVDVVTVARQRPLSHGTLSSGAYVRLSVTDRGHGIDTATMERMFEPFFTTRRAGSGTGLGLSTVHGIVAQHGGSLNVRSRPGKGSTFEAWFPQTDQPVPVEQPDAPPVQGNGQTVLLVDDEEPLVQLGEEMLAALGYEPVGFVNGPAALAAFRADPHRFDLVLTDEVMPGVTGTELAMAMHEIRPELPVVLMTGHGAPVRSRSEPAAIREILRKPLLSADIAQCLARNLAENRFQT